MLRIYLLIYCCCILSNTSGQQLNIISTNPAAEQVMKRTYNPQLYMPSVVISHPDSISKGIFKRVNADSLKSYLEQMRVYMNRNTGSDTTTMVKGIGAARKWAFRKFQQFSNQNGGRLLPSYLQFDQTICNINRHKDIFAVLPGTDTTQRGIVLIEAHFDSRCADLCDTSCVAEGMEDNGSGSALVLELARVMSRYAYARTLVFVLTISEEQGLYGAEAFANYVFQKKIDVRAVLNNDVIGGVICGKTASPPSCSGVGTIDSTHVRLFSFGGFSSPHKGLARFLKLEYKEMIAPMATVPMSLHVMTPEDRTGRGGDHIPFRNKGYTSMRFTSANESGDANVSNPNYTDRQHTSSDVLGVDTDNDQVIDSFFVDFNYLKRNAIINGNGAGMAAIGPLTPDFSYTVDGSAYGVDIIQNAQYAKYRLGLRTLTYDWDTVYTFTGTTFSISLPTNTYIASVAAVDQLGVESLFSRELLPMDVTSIPERLAAQPLSLLQNKPNPSDESTTMSVLVNKPLQNDNALIIVTTLDGKEIKRFPLKLHAGMNEVEYYHGYHATGTYFYTLYVGGVKVSTRKMQFAN